MQGNADIKVFTSLTVKEPDEIRHDKMFVNKHKFVITSKDKTDKFQHLDQIFISFNSQRGCFI